MASLITGITWAMAIERVQRRLFNGWQSIAANVTSNEIALYLYEAIAFVICQNSNRNIQIEGVRAIPEGYITTYQFTSFTKNYTTGNYTITLPQPPVNLPLGYSIVSPYWGGNVSMSYPLIAINPNQRGFYSKLPTPNIGIFYWVENSTMYIDSKGVDLNTLGTLFVPMQSSRPATGNDSDYINLPDDQMSYVFDMVINKLTQRLSVPQDNFNDGVQQPQTPERQQ
jgi:hypothetical protein